ncbi:MAG: four helix bundle protein [Chitinophagaceae bacterium]|nr:four helix bundle protein [Chitinophagaceae bacterium]
MAYHDFTEMPVWQLGDKVVEAVYRITEILPKREDYALCSQLRSAAVSITGNIAEAFGRGHIKDKINFYYFARGSAYEVRSHLLAGIKAGYFSKETTEEIDQLCLQVVESLNKIIKGLRQ